MWTRSLWFKLISLNLASADILYLGLGCCLVVNQEDYSNQKSPPYPLHITLVHQIYGRCTHLKTRRFKAISTKERIVIRRWMIAPLCKELFLAIKEMSSSRIGGVNSSWTLRWCINWKFWVARYRKLKWKQLPQ